MDLLMSLASAARDRKRDTRERVAERFRAPVLKYGPPARVVLPARRVRRRDELDGARPENKQQHGKADQDPAAEIAKRSRGIDRKPDEDHSGKQTHPRDYHEAATVRVPHEVPLSEPDMVAEPVAVDKVPGKYLLKQSQQKS